MRIAAIVLVVSLTGAASARAQFDSGQIAGFVRDSSQAAVPGATVTAVNEGNGDRRTALTNDRGYYVFPDLPVGSYAVSVERSS